MHLVEISVVDQRYQAVMAVLQDGWKVLEVAEHFDVARQTVHRWIARHNAGGVLALADGSHDRPVAAIRSSRSSRQKAEVLFGVWLQTWIVVSSTETSTNALLKALPTENIWLSTETTPLDLTRRRTH